MRSNCSSSQNISKTFSGQQLRTSEQNGFHANFIISQPNPIENSHFETLSVALLF